jgi:hypothetical protein
VLARAQAEPATTVEANGATHLAWLWQQFGGTGEPVTAPYALRALDANADCAAQCWHVDPVHFAFARDHLLVAPLDESPTAEEEAVLIGHLTSALHELVAEAEPRLHPHRGHWLLTLARPWSMQATPLEGALGQSAHEHWPAGADAATWRKLLTEVQMRWHQEPMNEARETLGRRAINALWLHGGGSWAALPARPFGAVSGTDPVLRGWGLASGLRSDALHDEGDVAPARGDAVSIRRDLLLPAQFDDWGQWLEQLTQLEAALRDLYESCFAAGYGELALVLCGRRQVRIVRLRRGDSWRLWRSTPLPSLFAESE